MTYRRSRSASNRSPQTRRRPVSDRLATSRRHQLERLEDRRLLALGPQLVSIQPDGFQPLQNNDVRNEAFNKLTFIFSENQVIDASTLGGIRVTRSGFDGVFGDPQDVVMQPGFASLGETPDRVIMRFKESLPDDLYRIDIFGSGPGALRNRNGDPFNDGQNAQINFELDLGPQVIAVVPQPVSRQPNGSLAQAGNQIEVYFNNDKLFRPSAENPAFYQLIFTQDTVNNNDDVVFQPTTASYNSARNMVTLTFANDLINLINPNTNQPIGSGTFRLRVGTNEVIPAAPQRLQLSVATQSDFNTAGAVQIRFESDTLTAERFGSNLAVIVAKSDFGGPAAPTVNVIDNLVLVELNTNAGNETTAQQLVDAINADVQASALLTASIASGNANANIATPAINYSPITLKGLGSSFNTATDLGSLDVQSRLISSRIDPQLLFPLDLPGGNEPGHRNIPDEVGGHFEQHINPDFGGDALPGITTVLYNFKPNYGRTPLGQPLVNLITDKQKQRAREAFEVWSDYLGVQFLETEDQGLTVVTGDPTALDPTDKDVMNHAIGDPDPKLGFIVRVDPVFQDGMLILDAARQWNDTFGGEWFRFSMIGIGAMLGLERATDLPPSTLMAFANGTTIPGAPTPEPVFPGNHDITHGRFLHRPDSNDIDLYRFQVAPGNAGLLMAETFAERQPNSSLLDTVLTLYRQNPDGTRTQIAQNDDYFSEDSQLRIPLEPGIYFLGVSASGNNFYNPEFENSGAGGTSQGPYDLRLEFRPTVAAADSIRDAKKSDPNQPSTPLDGDADGKPGGVYNFWFKAAAPKGQEAPGAPRTIFVDKLVAGNRLGTLANPYDRINQALANARPGDIVRIVGNGGFDGDDLTLTDNFAYEIGFGNLPGQQLIDGTTMSIPKGVTTMIDAGAILKLQRARIGVGSSSLGVDRSGGALQVLGTPEKNVFFTSFLDESIGLDRFVPITTPRPGDWGGLVFRADLDNAEARFNIENEGVFLNYVNHADIRYGGGNVVIDSVQQIVTPIQIVQTRPTIQYNKLTRSADAAISADPDSFEETNFKAPRFQLPGLFTPDYERVGPDIHGNLVVNNSTNGLFIRIATPAGNNLRELTVAGRFDDTDIVHVLAENLRIQGTPGEAILELARPPVTLVTLTPRTGGQLPANTTFTYKVVFNDINGFEGRPSVATQAITLAPGQGTVQLNNLPPAQGNFVARRIYRSSPGGSGPYFFVAQLDASDSVFVDNGSVTGTELRRDPPRILDVTLTPVAGGTLRAGTYNYRVVFVDPEGVEGPSSDATSNLTVLGGSIQLDNLPPAVGNFVARRIYRSEPNGGGPYSLIAELDTITASYLDDGTTLTGQLDPTSFGVVRARTDARLSIDPGIVVKLEGARIEATFGSQFLAEGTDGREIIFTSKLDDRFGAGGTFDTNNDGNQDQPSRGDWGGLYLGHLGAASIDHALLTFGGGINKIEGTFTAFNVIEIHQAEVRIANSVIENNASGIGGQAPPDRFGRGANIPATIFVRGAQPALVGNIIRDNAEQALTIDANSFTPRLLPDLGRSTGLADGEVRFQGNAGPLVRENRLINNPINGMVIRGDVLTTQSIWDDADIVHVLFNTVIIPDFHIFGGLRLESSANQSLVVKFAGAGDNFDSSVGAGITATGSQLDIEDRIGGSLHIIGQPDFPVLLTSLRDDSLGAGLTPAGDLQRDTNNDGKATLPRPGDWRSIRIEQYSNDRNVEVILESESPNAIAPGDNATPDTAQFLGDLAPREVAGDDNLRLGFEIHGLLNQINDVDVYSFNGTAGTEVWLDIDRTTSNLNTIVELVDASGRLVARSDDSLAESKDPSRLFADPASIPANHVNPLQKQNDAFQPRHVSGLPKDFYSTNLLDAGMRLVLPGVVGTRSSYHVRVRSASNDLNDLTAGRTAGVYQLQIRLRETDEVPGSTVRFARIQFSTNGLELIGLPYHSPLVGEVSEDEETGGPEHNNTLFPNPFVPGQGPQDIGNFLHSDRGGLSIGGTIASIDDIDFYEFDVQFDMTANNFYQHAAALFDIDYADGLSRVNATISVFDSFGRLILIGQDSNISDDRGGPLDNGSLADFSRGSVGTKDPFIGVTELPQGTYFVAVSSDARVPQELLVNPLVRREPINSVIRIAEDHIGTNEKSTAADPVVRVLLDHRSVVPEAPQDVTLFFSRQDPAAGGNTRLVAVNPFTGQIEQRIGAFPRVLDIATRIDDGSLMAFSAPTAPQDGTAGLFYDINTRLATITPNPNDDGIITFIEDPNDPGSPLVANRGVNFNALTFGRLLDATGVEEDQQRLFAVGNRGDSNLVPRPAGPQFFTNLLYQFDPLTGLATSAPQADRTGDARLNGGGTQIVERGFLDTAAVGLGGNITGLAILDGKLYAVSDAAELFEVLDPTSDQARLRLIRSYSRVIPDTEPNNAIASAQNLDPEFWTLAPNGNIGNTIINTSTTNPHVTIAGTGDGTVDVYSFTATAGDIGVFDIDGGIGGPGSMDTELFLFDAAGNLLNQNDDALVTFGQGGSAGIEDAYLQHTFNTAGRYFIVVAARDGLKAQRAPIAGETYTLHVSMQNHAYAFTAMTSRSRFGVNDPFEDLLFMTDSGGDVFSIDVNGTPQLFFQNNTSARVSTNVTGANGIAFSQINLWHITDRRDDDFGHGLVNAFDDSRGNNSLVFEIEQNDTIATAHDLEQEFWSTGYDANIGDATMNTSTTIPHVTIKGSGDNSFDFYRFRVDIPPDDLDGIVTGIFDIDIDFDELNDPNGAFDAELYLVDEAGNLLAASIDAAATLGAQGSTRNVDPFIQFAFNQSGNYAILVTGILQTPVQVGDFYTLQVSLEEHRNDGALPGGGKSFYFGHERGDYDQYKRAGGSILTNPFSLSGYAAADKPVLYFTYLADVDVTTDILRVAMVESNGTETTLAIKNAQIINDALWRQVRVPLDQFAGKSDLRLRFLVDTVNDVDNQLFEGMYLDDIIIGFAERGEMVTAAGDNPNFAINPASVGQIVTGAYQLEVRRGTDFGTSSNPGPTLRLNQTFDTNDRHVRALTLTAPAGAAILDGQTFTVSDGVDTLTYEFDNAAARGITAGNIGIVYSSTDSASVMAGKIRDAINSSPSQTVLDVTAGLADGTVTGPTTNTLVNLHGNAIVNGYPFGVTVHGGSGDGNLFRDQGQVLLHSNNIVDARDFGIVADAGDREAEDRVPHGFLQTHPGAVRKLRELNIDPVGGLIPGATLENNVIAGEGLGGIHFSGLLQPYEITILRPTAYPLQNIGNATAGDRVCDGQTFVVHAYRTTLTFEYEDIGGGPRNPICTGSGIQGGDGWTPGNIPVLYRKTGPGYLGRTLGYTQTEMATAIRDAIQGSILVTNGTTLTVDADIHFSRAWGHPLGGPDPAVFVSGLSSVQTPTGQDCPSVNPFFGSPCAFSGRHVAVHQAPQSFGRLINNTVFGNDGETPFFAGSGFVESNDTIFKAVQTHQGRQHHPGVYRGTANIGDSVDFPADPTLDVDFYQFNMGIGDRVSVDLGTQNIIVNDPSLDPASIAFTQSETSMLLFGNTVIIGYNDSGSTQAGNKFTGYSISVDGGNTFTDMGELPTHPSGDGGDPVLARDNTTGTIYFSTLDGTPNGPIQVFRSFDNGQTFAQPVIGTPGKVGFQDKEWMTVDNFAGLGRGNVYLVARDFGVGNGIYFFRSTNGGASFGPNGGTLIASAATGNVQGAWVTVGSNHDVYVFYYQAVGVATPPQIMMRKSTDLGATFGSPVVVAPLTSLGVNGDLGMNFRSNTFPQVVVNPVSGNLYMTFADQGLGLDRADVYFTESANGGASWSTPVRINDDTTINDQWQPTIAVTPNGEDVGIFWYDRRLSSNNVAIDYFGRIGEVQGNQVVFNNPSFRVSDNSFQPIFGLDPLVGGTYMGDYDQAQADNNAFYVTWADNSLGTPDIRFARVRGSQLDGELRLFDAQGKELASSSSTPAFLEFIAAEAGTYYVGVSGRGNNQYDALSLGSRIEPTSSGDYDIAIDVRSPRTWVITAIDGSLIPDGTTFQVTDINDNTVTYEFDDVRTPGVAAGNIAVIYDGTPIPAMPGGTRLSGYRPPEMAVTMAATIGQGLSGVSAVALGGIQGASPGGVLPSRTPVIFPDTVPRFPGFSHDTPLTPLAQASTELYVVISGATKVEGKLDLEPFLSNNIDQLLPETGILVSERSSPTLLNNVLANLESGIIQDTSPTTVVGASLYQHNANADSNIGASGSDFNISLGNFEPLFVNSADRNFYPAPLSRTIDSALDSLEERDGFGAVKNAMGIPVSPILAPDRDAAGLLRADDPDVATPSGQGANVFKDRGALDRADFLGPNALLIDPQDNDAQGIDLDPAVTVVQLSPGVYRQFVLQLVDEVGVDDRTVESSKVTLTEDGVLLQEDVDYTYSYDAATNVIRLAPISGFWKNDKVYVIEINNTDRFVIDVPDGGMVSDGQSFFILDKSNAKVTFEYESGYSLLVPQTLTLQVPAAGVGFGGVQDGERFTINDGLGGFFTFEFDRNSPPNTLPNNIRVDISTATNANDVAAAIVTAVNNAAIGVTAVNLGNGQVHFGALARYSVDTRLTSVTQFGRPGIIGDGQTFSIRNGANPAVIFEFDNNNIFVDANRDGIPDNVLIRFNNTFTQNDFAQAIRDAVASAAVGLVPTNFGGGHVHLGGTLNHVVNAAAAPNLTLNGAPGVSPSTTLVVPVVGAGPNGITDGQTFRIDDGLGRRVTFEFDSNSNFRSGNRPILFSPGSNRDQLANAIVSAITIANVGLNPVNLGSGQVRLFDTIRHAVDIRQSALTKFGVPGGAVAVPFLPDATFTPSDMAPVVINAIKQSALSGVIITSRGGGTFFADNLKSISGSLPNFFQAAIKDLAGNNLRPNQPNSETQFVILMPDVELDFGDAPDPTYPTLFANNGARHVIPDTPLFLGAGVTADADGKPSAAANLDANDDGVVFDSILNSFIVTPVTVTASADAFLDGWIDFNRDGDWDDPGEQIFSSQPVTAGTNVLSTATPALADPGLTLARFRLSSQGSLRPTGVAVDGEVEDYLIEIVAGRPPVANDDAYGTDEDTVLNVLAPGVIDNDTDVDSPKASLRVDRFDATSSLGATIVMNADGSFSYDPITSATLQGMSVGASMTDTFRYRLVDDKSLPSNFATVSITVTGLNDQPVATDDTYSVNEDNLLSVPAPGVLGNDRDPDTADVLTVSNFDNTSALGATVVVNANGSFTYDPRSAAALQSLQTGQSVQDTFTYTVSDGNGGSDTATVTITVGGTNDAPVAVDDAYLGNEDELLSKTAAEGVLVNDRDPDAGDTFTVTGFSASSALGAVVSVAADGSFSYDPRAVAALQALPVGTSQPDTFTYTITDSRGATDTATVTITVEGRNDNPIGVNDNYATDQDKVLNVPAAGVLANDSDIDTGDTLSVTAFDVISAKGAAVSVQPNGALTYDPTGSATLQALQPDEKTNDTFTYTVTDNNGASTVVTVTVEVTGVNVPPNAVDDLFTTDEDTPLDVSAPGVLGNDSDADGQPFTIVGFDNTTAFGVSIVLNADGSFSYDPTGVAAFNALDTGEVLQDTFRYTIRDTFNATDTATVTIRVTGVNDAPVANNDAATARRATPTPISVLANDTDPENKLNPASIVIVSNPSRGTAVANANGTVTYTGNAGLSGPDTFTYSVVDQGGLSSNVATVTVNVNEPPTANNDTVNTLRNTPVTISVLANDTDIDGTLNPGSIVIKTAPTQGTATPNANGTVTYRPNNGFLGSDSFTYTVKDDDGAESNVATVNIAVLVNPFPWQNSLNRLDVNADGFVSPIDALLVINDLNFNGSRDLPVPPVPPFTPPPFLDTSGNNRAEALDALLVINFLNNPAGPEGEGSAALRFQPDQPIIIDPQLLSAPATRRQAATDAPAVQADVARPARPTTGEDPTDHDLWGTAGQRRLSELTLEDTLADIADDVALSSSTSLQDTILADWLAPKRRS